MDFASMNDSETSSPLLRHDPDLYDLIQQEYTRQKEGLELIASENFTSPAVLECLGSVLTNKYSEGLPGARYYGGNQVIDQIEDLCRFRALLTFELDPEQWGVNVQPYSGSVANMAAYLGLLSPHDRIMGLDLPSGGHLTHGYYTAKRKISSTSIVFESLPYHVGSDGYIDYEELQRLAGQFKPKLIICGASAYPREIDYARFREIADQTGAYLLCDMAHISGLVATRQLCDPFPFCDVVTTTTHKTLRGPRAGMIFFRQQLAERINFSVFPGVQGGPHQNQIAAIATQLLEVKQPPFQEYTRQVILNAKALATQLIRDGYTLATGGTENHLVLVNLRPLGITGSKIEKICERVDISINKNAIVGDKSALQPGGIRLGTAALTTRGFKEEDFIKVATFLDTAIQLALRVQQQVGKKLVDFETALDNHSEVFQLQQSVKSLASKFPFPS